MIEPYQALGLVPTRRGIRHRDEIQVNLEHRSHLTSGTYYLTADSGTLIDTFDRQIELMHERDIWRRPDKATRDHNDGASLW